MSDLTRTPGAPVPFTAVVCGELRFVEGRVGEALLSTGAMITSVIEACFEARSRRTLLYAENLPPGFFDLSSGVAGTVLQKLRNYGVRLAVVRGPTTGRASHRFGEMGAEDDRGAGFALFDDRPSAIAWLGR